MILLVGFVFLIELLASSNWNELYFMGGIPIYKRRITSRGVVPNLPSDVELTERFKSDGWHISLFFKALSDYTIAYRTKLTGARATPLMHGVMRLKSGGREVEMTGYVDWWLLLCMPTLILTGYDIYPPSLYFMIPFMLLVLLICYFIQAADFNRVAEYLREKYEGSPSPQPVSREERG